MALTALVKLSDRFGHGYFDSIRAILEPFRTSSVIELQQRACEFSALLEGDYDGIRSNLLERMPPLDIDNAKAMRANAQEAAEDDSDGDGYDNEYDDDDE